MFFYSEQTTIQESQNTQPIPDGFVALVIEEGLYLVSEENGLYIVLE